MNVLSRTANGKNKFFFILLIAGAITVMLVVLLAAVGGGIYDQEQQDQNNCDNLNSDSRPVGKVGKISVKSGKNIYQRYKNIAMAVAPKVGVKPRLLFAQLVQEGGDGSQPVDRIDNNFGGMTWSPNCGYPKGTARPKTEGGNYRHYKNDSEFATDWAKTLKADFARTGKPRSIQDYVNKAKSQSYMQSNDLTNYANGMKYGYSLWKGKSSLSSAAKVADSADSDTGEDCDDTSSSSFSGSGSILKEARHWLGKFNYDASRTADAHWKHPDDSDTTDCSGFVWFVLKRTGYAVTPQVWSTPFMESDAKGAHKYLKRISAKNAKKGDLIIVNVGSGSGSLGHTAFLAENYHGNNTKVIEMGGNGNKVNEQTIAYSFTSLLPNGRVTFAEPKKVSSKK